jgi:hypothetical protein
MNIVLPAPITMAVRSKMPTDCGFESSSCHVESPSSGGGTLPKAVSTVQGARPSA